MASAMAERDWWGTGNPPESSVWPRLMTGPHPRAVGSYGPEMIKWAEPQRLHARKPSPARWWQQLAACRALEHDELGKLVWPLVIISAPRQQGKSYLERITCWWRIHQAPRWDEEQNVLHCAHKLVAAQEVWRPAARWAAGFPEEMLVRRASGEERIELADGSRWMIQAANDGAGVAFSLQMALLDEGWRIRRRIFDEAIAPTMAEAESPQAWLVSTAGTSDSDLMLVNRESAIASLDDPQDVLLIEWSAPPDDDLDIDDPAVWRRCQAHWDAKRADVLRRERQRGTERSFRQQWLNMWVPGLNGSPLGDMVWEQVATTRGPGDPVMFGAEVAGDRTSACVMACDGQVAELVEHRDGAGWVAGRLKELADRHDAAVVAVHGAGPAASVAADCADALGARLVVLTSGQMGAASGKLFDVLTSSPPGLLLRAHPVLQNGVLSAERRQGMGGWSWSRDSAGMVLSATSAALWAYERAQADRPMVFV